MLRLDRESNSFEENPLLDEYEPETHFPRMCREIRATQNIKVRKLREDAPALIDDFDCDLQGQLDRLCQPLPAEETGLKLNASYFQEK